MARKNLDLIARPVLILGALLLMNATMAVEAAVPANQEAKSNCAAGAKDCAPAMVVDARIREATRQAREAVCGRDTQACDARGKARRRDADVEVRDRHACRER